MKTTFHPLESANPEAADASAALSTPEPSCKGNDMTDKQTSLTNTVLSNEADSDNACATAAPAAQGVTPPSAIEDSQGNLIIDGIDLNALRINPAATATVGVKPLITSIPIMKPKKSQFIQVCATRPAFPYSAFAIDGGQGVGYYLVTNGVELLVPHHAKAYSFHLAINRSNQLFLLPLNEQRTNGHRHSSADSLELALEQAKRAWVQIVWSQDVMGYLAYEAVGSLAAPVWPALTDNDILNLAFKGRIITTVDHPIIQALQGAA